MFERTRSVWLVFAVLMSWGHLGTTAMAQDDVDGPVPEEAPNPEPAPEEVPNPEPAPEETPAPEPETASSPVPAGASDPGYDWKVDYERGMRTARAGQITGAVGFGLAIAGAAASIGAVVSGNEAQFGPGMFFLVVGGVGAAVGPPIIAAGSIRANRALQVPGYEDRPPVLGYATWALWGGSLVMGQIEATEDVTPLVFLGSYVTGIVQATQNRASYRRGGSGVSGKSGSPLAFRVSPYARRDAQGMVLAGTF